MAGFQRRRSLPARTRARPFRMSTMPLKKAPSAMTMRGAETFPSRLPGGETSTRWRPGRRRSPGRRSGRPAPRWARHDPVHADHHRRVHPHLPLDLAVDQQVGAPFAVPGGGPAAMWVSRRLWDRRTIRTRRGARGRGLAAEDRHGSGPALLSRRRDWSGQRDSNPRHQAWEACTLPTELCPLDGSSRGKSSGAARRGQGGPRSP